jgi:4Fe-4S ferredoxin
MSTTPPRLDKAKARKAAVHPDRPGEECRAAPGAWVPHIARSKCEGKADCIAVCPYDVFEIGQISDQDFAAMSLLQRFKSRVHGRRTVFTPRADACQACGLCVVACPERAITLVPK